MVLSEGIVPYVAVNSQTGAVNRCWIWEIQRTYVLLTSAKPATCRGMGCGSYAIFTLDAAWLYSWSVPCPSWPYWGSPAVYTEPGTMNRKCQSVVTCIWDWTGNSYYATVSRAVNRRRVIGQSHPAVCVQWESFAPSSPQIHAVNSAPHETLVAFAIPAD